MGQPSIPSLNKTGESMYWSSMWDDKHDFNISLIESIFLKEFIPGFFQYFSEHKIVSYLNKHNFLLNKHKIKNNFDINITKSYNFKELTLKMEKNNEKMFFSQIWVMKFQNWVLVYFFVYNPFFEIKKKQNINKNKNYYLNNILKNYVESLIVLKYQKSKKYNMYNKKYSF